MRRQARFWRGLGICGVAAGVLTVGPGCRQQTPATRTPVPVRVQMAEPGGSRSEPLRYAASIEAYDVAPLSFRVGGYVVAVAQRRGTDGRPRDLQEGDRVSRGEVLARVRAADYDAQVDQVRGRVSEAEAGLQKAQQDHARAQRLFAQQSLTRPELESAKAALDAAQARVAAARGGLSEARLAQADTALRAPADGVVLSKRIETGVLVGPGVEVVRIGRVRAVRALFGVPDTALGTFQTGETVLVTAEGVSDARFTGTISAIAPAADPQSRSFTVEARIDNARGALRPGMVATVEAEKRTAAAAAPLLPLSAVVRAPGNADAAYAVFVVEDQGGVGVAKVRGVTLGNVVGNRIEVARGIGATDRVVVTGATLLHDGDAVRVIP